MPILIGTDEAGYGPNYGPLVIAASVWEVHEGVAAADLYQRLKSVIAPAAERGDCGAARVAMADSKLLYQAGQGLRLLERGVLAALGVLDCCPDTCGAVWRQLTAALPPDREGFFGLNSSRRVPLDADAADLQEVSARLRAGLAAAGVRLAGLYCRAIFPDEFNALVARYDSKGSVLSHATLELVARAMTNGLGDGSIAVLCDKHGGRNYYLPLLMEYFPDAPIMIREEGTRSSRYVFGPPERRVEIGFQVRAEAHLPAALASMAAKYLRELAMRAFNDYWCARVSDLQPTAGYPQDAPRFKGANCGRANGVGRGRRSYLEKSLVAA